MDRIEKNQQNKIPDKWIAFLFYSSVKKKLCCWKDFFFFYLGCPDLDIIG